MGIISKRSEPFAGLCLSFDYGQFLMAGSSNWGGVSAITDEDLARGYIASKNGEGVLVLPAGSVGVAQLHCYWEVLPGHFYKKRFSARLDLRSGQLWFTVVDGRFTFFGVPPEIYRLEFGLKSSTELGGQSMERYDIAFSKVDPE